MKLQAIDHTAIQVNEDHLSINEVVTAISKDSQAQDPMLREYELTGAMRVCDLLSRTGLVRIPAIVYGALQSEHDRIAAITASTVADVVQKATEYRTGKK